MIRKSRRALLLLFAVGMTVLAAPVARSDDKDAIDRALDQCLATDAGSSTAGMIDCTSTALRAWDVRLNDTYQRALAALDPKSRDLLRAAQRQWLAFRTADRAAMSGPWLASAGSIARVSAIGLELSATKERISELRLYLPPD
jgi:uncharacterized protein YecT (DUF1311 family)